MNRLTSALDAVRVDDLHSTEEQFRAVHPVCWRMTLYGPVVLTLALVGLLLAYTGWEFTSKLITSAVIAVFVLGRFIILSGANGTFQDTDGAVASEHLVALVCYFDIMTALVLAFHIGFLFRLPYVGQRIAALVTDGHFILDAQPWMRRATFFGLIAFVGFPLAATGSIGGSIFGRLLGMSRFATFIGIVIGTVVGNMTMFLFSDWLGNYVDKENFYLKYGGLLIIVALVVILERRYRKLKNRYASERHAAVEPTDAAAESLAVAAERNNEAAVAVNGAAQPKPAVRHRDGYPVCGHNGFASVEEEDALEIAAGDRSGSRHHPS